MNICFSLPVKLQSILAVARIMNLSSSSVFSFVYFKKLFSFLFFAVCMLGCWFVFSADRNPDPDKSGCLLFENVVVFLSYRNENRNNAIDHQ